MGVPWPCQQYYRIQEASVNGIPHAEVVNKQPAVLIVGYGHVGRQIGKYFTEADYVDIDGTVRRVSDDTPIELSPDGYQLGFICVPTPQLPSGRCEISIVRDAYEDWRFAVRYWCVKSTVEVGTVEGLGENVCFSPEYYGETVDHPLRSELSFVILGGPSEVTQAFATAWTLVTSSELKIYQTDARTAELCKLMENSWIATKVSFCNEFYRLAQAADVDWHELRELWLADPRVSRSHSFVFPDNRGWGGKCLPKDTANLCHWARYILGCPATLLESIREENARLRGKTPCKT
jgi:UDPglucose 6-dehydrogenase